jgi:fatty-acyl-CoA synthase
MTERERVMRPFLDSTGSIPDRDTGSLLFLDRFHAHVRARPDDVFVVISDGKKDAGYRSVTFAGFERQVAASARRLRQAGVKPGTFACLVGRTGIALVAAFTACLEMGAVAAIFPPPSPLQDPTYYRDQQKRSLAIAAPDFLVLIGDSVSAFVCDMQLPGAIRILHLEDEADPGSEDEANDLVDMFSRQYVRDPDSPFFVQHSSGTTGIKKGVAITERQVSLQLDLYTATLFDGGSSPPVIASWLPLYHDMGLVACLLTAMHSGARLCLIDAFDWSANPASLFDLIEREAASHVWMPNFAFKHLVRCHPRGATRSLASVRAWINCSEPCRAETMDAFVAHFGRNGVRDRNIACCYAMAETVFAVSQSKLGAAPRILNLAAPPAAIGRPILHAAADMPGFRLASNGRPLAGVEIRIEVDGKDVGAGIVGEIWVRSAFLFSGYFRRPELSAEVIDRGWYRTGDIGFCFDGEIYVTGRGKEIIIIHGKNYFCGDIEFAIGMVAGLKPGRCVAFGIYCERSGSEELVVLAERDASTSVEPADLGNRIRDCLAREFDLTPLDVRVVDERWLVKSTSGKVSRSANVVKYNNDFQNMPAMVGGILT